MNPVAKRGLWQACRRQKCINIFKTGVNAWKFFSLLSIPSDSIKRKIFRELLFFRCHTCSGRDGHRCKGGQQQNNLPRAVSLLHRVLVHPRELSATSAFSLKTRHSGESEVPADFGDLNSVRPAAGIFCLLQAKQIVCPPGETYSVSCSFVFLTRAHHATCRKRNRECLLFAPGVQSAAVISLADLLDI